MIKMETRNKLILIMFTTFFVLGGGVYYLITQFDSTAPLKLEITYFFEGVMMPEEQDLTTAQTVPTNSRSRVKSSSNDDSSDILSMSGLEIPTNKVHQSSLNSTGISNGSFALHQNEIEKGLSSTNSGGGGTNLIAQGKSDGGYSNEISDNNLSPLSNGGFLMGAPTKQNGWVLIDPEPTILNEGDQHQIVPVGDGFYFIALLALLYGLFKHKRIFLK